MFSLDPLDFETTRAIAAYQAVNSPARFACQTLRCKTALPADLGRRVFAIVKNIEAEIQTPAHETAIRRDDDSFPFELAAHDQIAGLHHLDHEDTLADCVRHAALHNPDVARLHLNAVETGIHRGDILFLDDAFPAVAPGRMLEAKPDAALDAVANCEYVVDLELAERRAQMLPGESGGWMRLHVQAHRRIEQFREEAQLSPQGFDMPVTEEKIRRPADKPRQGGFSPIGQPDARQSFRGLRRQAGVGGLYGGCNPTLGLIGVDRLRAPLESVEQLPSAIIAANARREHGDEPWEGWIANKRTDHDQSIISGPSDLASLGKLALPGICFLLVAMASCRIPGVLHPFHALVLCLLTISPPMSDRLGAEQNPPGLVNLACQRAAYQSGAIDDNQTAHLATDGSERTFWESRPEAGQWIAVDLGWPAKIAQVKLHWGAGYPTAYRLEVSDDTVPASHWRTVYQTEEGTGGIEEIALGGASARLVRMFATTYANKRGCVLREFEVLGPAGPPPPAPAPFALRDDGALVMSGGPWRLQNAMFVEAAPATISRFDFDDSTWLPAVVPGTVLTSYLRHGAIPDPRIGDQQTQISESFFTDNDFWYRTTFTVPAAARGRRLWLAFDGINWQAAIYCNGVAIGRIDRAFLRGRFEVTSVVRPGETNCLAVLVRRVAHPGVPRHKLLDHRYDNGGILGLDSPTFVSSIGWNWLPTIRGRNVGIWDEVRLESTGDVSLVDPWVTSTLPLPDTSRADLTVRAELVNHASQPGYVDLVGQIGEIHFRHSFRLAPGEIRAVALDRTVVPELALQHPRLWWPNGYGAQPLYQLKLTVEQAGVPSDTRQVTFGIRQVDHEIVNGVLFLQVNGCRILCRGATGAWTKACLTATPLATTCASACTRTCTSS